jgi:hypothetical protein
MSLNSGKSRLAALTKDLAAHWRETRESWRDDRAREFELRYLDELFSGVTTTINNLDTLERLLNQIRDDCE